MKTEAGRTMNDWPHQIRGVNEVLAAIERGERRICLTSPTGGGKTRIMQRLIEHYLSAGKSVVLYTNRRMLIDQLSRDLFDAGLDHGIRAAGHDDEHERPFQISSIQTEASRTLKRGTWKLHPAHLVLIDEAHLQTAETARKLLDAHREQGAACVGFTATPLDLAELYDLLITAGTMTELRECGALVLAEHFGPDEPDFRAFKKLQAKLNSGENLSEREAGKVMMTPGIFGRVWTWFERLNPEHKPTILFAPGVRESLWFAEQFSAKGVRAAHIDGQEVWIDGNSERTSSERRLEILQQSRDGRIVVLCNRFVLREGIDAPWLAHGIMATVFGSIQSYLQSGGRLPRAYHGVNSVTIQDHGGNWHRHGSLNVDRQWFLESTPSMVAGLRAQRLRDKKEREPMRCPGCGRICSFWRCPCGYEFGNRKVSRPVVSTDGSLKELTGDIFEPRRICTRPDGVKLWEQMYWRSRTKKGARTFAAAFALFAYENNWTWPSREWPLMPVEDLDVHRLVADVPMERLTQQCMSLT